MSATDASFVTFRGISKSFGGVSALRDVSLGIARGECHGLMGENGAGKSTLGKVLAGLHGPDAGELTIDGALHRFSSPQEAMASGVAMVHQELAFCPDLSVAENLCMGRYPRWWGGLLLDSTEMAWRAGALLARIGVDLDVWQPMRDLSTAQEQLVQIAAAIGTDPRILVFDEPTSSLAEPDAQNLFRLIEELKTRGLTTVYVSHRMPELFRLCDRISVLRDGRYVGTLAKHEMTHDAVVRLMIGRSVEEYFPRHLAGAGGQVVLRVRNLASPGRFRNVGFEVRTGEIVGFAGLVGAGRSEVTKAIFGLDRAATARSRLTESRWGSGPCRGSCARASAPCRRTASGRVACSGCPAGPTRAWRCSNASAMQVCLTIRREGAGACHGFLRAVAGQGRIAGGHGAIAERRQPAEDRARQVAGRGWSGAHRR